VIMEICEDCLSGRHISSSCKWEYGNMELFWGSWLCQYEIQFRLEHDKQDLGLPIGQHLFIRVNNTNYEYVVRAYTPISRSSMLLSDIQLSIVIHWTVNRKMDLGSAKQ